MDSPFASLIVHAMRGAEDTWNQRQEKTLERAIGFHGQRRCLSSGQKVTEGSSLGRNHNKYKNQVSRAEISADIHTHKKLDR